MPRPKNRKPKSARGQARAGKPRPFLLEYARLDVFTDTPFAGNPLAVFAHTEKPLSTAAMQTIAAELNLSESVFFVPPSIAGAHTALRIFTPAAELPFAGHPCVGAAFVFAADRAEYAPVFETKAGLVEVRVSTHPPRAEVKAPLVPSLVRALTAPEALALATSMGLGEDDLAPLAAGVYACGPSFAVLPLRAGALARAVVPQGGEIEAAAGKGVGLYAVAPETESVGSPDNAPAGSPDDAPENAPETGDVRGAAWRARMFAPHHGIVEDPATGSAACAFAAWHRQAGFEATEIRIRQGVEMGRASVIDLTLDPDGAVRLGGTAVSVGRGCIDATSLLRD